MKKILYVGHAETVAVAEAGGRSLGTIGNWIEAIRKLVKTLRHRPAYIRVIYRRVTLHAAFSNHLFKDKCLSPWWARGT